MRATAFIGDGTDVKLGATFGVAVVGSVLAIIDAGLLLTFARSSGDGPFYKCVHDCMSMNTANVTTAGGGTYNTAGAWNQPQTQPEPPAPMAAAAPPAPSAEPSAAAAQPPSATAAAGSST